MRTGRTVRAALAALGALALAPAAAHGATVTVTGDDGNPVTLTPGVPLTIRQMDFDLGVVRSPAARYLKRSVTAPDGAQIANSAETCWILDSPTAYLTYRGNGTYTAVVSEYSNNTCTAPVGAPATYQFVVAAGVSIAPPPGVVLTRPKNSFATNTHELGFSGNPGAFGYDVQYARGGVVGPDGAISGPSSPAFVNSTTGRLELRLSVPGTYTVVARARGGDFNSPWSAPVSVRAIAPFDLSFTSFPDSRGPSYSVKGTLREKFARGKVKIAIARGKRGGKFRSLGKARIRSNGTFYKRFTVRRVGRYRLRYSFGGSSLVQKGSVTEGIRIRRRIF